jgi:phage gpG-like protein
MQEWGMVNTRLIGTNLTISLHADKSPEELTGDLDGIRERAADMSPVMLRIGLHQMQSTRRTFRAEGRPKKWAPLAPATIADRIRKGFGPRPILKRTGRLMDSLTKPNHKDQIFKVTRNSMTLGSEVPYHKYHQRRKGKIPQRVTVIFLAQDIRIIASKIWDYVFLGEL